MNKEDFLFCGQVRKVFGYKGEVVIIFTSSGIFDLEKDDFLFLETPFGLVPYQIEDIRPSGGESYIVKFTDIHNENEAELIKDFKIYIPIASIDITDNDENIPADFLKAYQLNDKDFGFIGSVAGIIEMKNQSLLEVEKDGKIFLIPFVREMILKFDHKKKVIYTSLPEGLMELNEE